MRNFWSFFFSLSFLFAYDTLWFRLYDSGVSFGIEVDPSGNIVVCGQREADILLIKYSPSGEIIWSRIIDDEDRLFLSRLAIDKEGNIIVVSSYYRYPAEFGGYIVKCDNEGNILWIRKFPINWCGDLTCVVCDDSNNIIVAGDYAEGKEDNEDEDEDDIILEDEENIILIKYSPNGNLIWTKRYDFGERVENIRGLIKDREGNIVGAGIIGDGEYYDLLVVKFNKNGDTIWVSRIDFQPEDWGENVAVDSANNIYVCGSSGFDTLYAFVVKYNQYGDTVWARFYENYYSHGNAVSIDKLGNILVAGYAEEVRNIPNALLIKYSPFGDTIFSQLFNFSPDSGMWAEDMALINDSNYIYITGTFRSGRNYNIYLMKLLYQPAISEKVSCKILFTLEDKTKEVYDITGKRIIFKEKIKPGIYFLKVKDKKNFLKVIIKSY